VLRGEAGIGKTALLEYVLGQAEDFRVLRVTGIESEMELGFAALYQLVHPFLANIPLLPEPQRAALESVFGLAGGPAPDRFLVGLATMTLLSGVASSITSSPAPDENGNGPAGESGLLIAVDDAQWLDRASAEVLAFVARRLYADRIALVFTVREAEGNQEHFDGLKFLQVRALAAADARELITSLGGGLVAPGVAGQIAERAGGNPLALVETARELTREQLAGAATLPDPLPLGADAQDRYWRKVSVLPPGQREFLLLAAAEPLGDPELFEKAAGYLDLDPRLARTAEISRLVTVADRVTFRHPLIRSAVYNGSSSRARRRVHAALAAVSDPDRDQDRVAWHRAAAATEPDEEIARLLENAADRARGRGRHAAAVTFLLRAAGLSSGEERRGERLLAAARAEFTAGRVSQAEALLDQADPDLRDLRRRAESVRLRGEIQTVLGDGHRAPSTLLRAARALAPRDPDASRDALLDAMAAEIYAGGREWLGTFAGIRAAYPGAGGAWAGFPGLVLDGYAAQLTDGPALGGPFLRRAVRTVIAEGLPDDQRMRWYTSGILCATDLLDFGAWHLLSDRLVMACRARGALTALPLALDHIGTWQAYAGHLDAAEAANAEGREILAATGTPDRLGVRGAELLVPAWRGQEALMRKAAAEMTRDCARRGQRRAILYPDLAFTIVGIGKRDYAAALDHARVLLDDNGFCLGAVVLPYAVEAAVRCRDQETAELALSRLGARAAASPTDWVLGLLAQGRALTLRSAGPDGDAEREALFGEAIACLDRVGALFDLARTRLLFGEWLRRRRRRARAREELVAARQSFQAMGAAAFAERARLELAASGARGFTGLAEGDGTRTAETALTERETQIARLVAGGATNAEVASQLFISASTVDYHLRHVYRKLGVRSRTELAVVFRRRP
jgi:DNA-binding CsgD family transcriptional regulator